MRRNRVLSFMSQLGSHSRSPGPGDESAKPDPLHSNGDQGNTPPKQNPADDVIHVAPAVGLQALDQPVNAMSQSPSTPSRARGDARVNTRPLSMMQTYNPPQVEVAADTPPELQPIFTFLNSHSNKLYQEGYFLKLHDLDSRGRPSQARVWNECFAQLVGTVLSLWDAAALDAAGEDGEVMPTFINLSDATIKMIESLPMNGAHGGNLQNVLSISTAANNRYLLHFNSLNSLTQWTAGIRLSIYEQSTLQEAYTGSLIAGKGRYLNNIKQIMDRSKFTYEDWARVRFGAGTPWRRCWCVISPPDEKEYQKAAKVLRKSSSYSRPALPKGDIKFYDTRKITKKTRPLATISDAYAAYAIYPQSKPLIDQSTLVKLEGLVTMHTSPETTSEGFVFVMPEVHPAVSGFEMMLRWLFRVFDTFGLYGRPSRLVADTLDQRGLMFAMPQDRRYGYLDTLDVSGLIHTTGSQGWTERQWRKEMKKLTAQRLATYTEGAPRNSRQSVRRGLTSRTSMPPPQRNNIRFDDPGSIHSSPGSRSSSPVQNAGADGRVAPPRRTDSAPPQAFALSPHKRSVSDAQGYRKYATETPSRLSHEASRQGEFDAPPAPPVHGGALAALAGRSANTGLGRVASIDDLSYEQAAAQASKSSALPPPEPVVTPPAFTHTPNSRPPVPLVQAPELRRAHSNVDADTLHQMRDAQHVGDEYASDSQATPERAYQDAYAYRQSDMRLDDLDAISRDARQRLSTIPGSPYVDAEGEFLDAHRRVAMPQMDAVVDSPDAWITPQEESTDGRPPLVPLHSSQSIARKPIPKKLPQVPSGEDEDPYQSAPAAQVRDEEVASLNSSSPISPVGSFEGALIDQDALERILNQETDHADTMLSHVSSATPDYASTASFTSRREDRVPTERPRAGKLKTVGDPDLPVIDARSGGAGRLDTYHKDKAAHSAEIPSIDFGPTYAYKPHSRPGTSGTMTPKDILSDPRSRSRSGDRLRGTSGDRLSHIGPSPKVSPGESNRHSYFGGRITPNGLERSDSPSQQNSVAWTPSGPSPGPMHQSRTSLTPEQWVQYRATLAAQPQLAPRMPVPTYAHQRQGSGQSDLQVRQSMSRTPPPFSRSPSGDWTQSGQQTPPSRPNSRSTGVYLNQSPGGHALSSTNLTAKEQMHVARATGSPLINLPSHPRKPQDDQGAGLVGALAAREREKAAIKEGVRTSVVQQAILSRQHQQAQLEAEAFAQAQAQFQAQAQYETQQQLAYQQALMAQQQSQVYAGPQQQLQPTQYAQSQQARMSWDPSRVRTGSPSMLQMQQGFGTPPLQQSPQVGAFNGMYAQQQQPQHQRPMSVSLQSQQGQQQGYHVQPQPYGQQYYAQPQQQQGQWQAPRK